MKTGRLLAAGLLEKLKESLISVLPTIILVLALSFTVAPISSSILLCFLMGGALLILGMMFFTLGAELAMTPMGERVGTCITRSKRLWMIIALAFFLGFIITISEPCLLYTSLYHSSAERQGQI